MHHPAGLPLLVQPVVIEPRRIDWLADIEGFVPESVAFD